MSAYAISASDAIFDPDRVDEDAEVEYRRRVHYAARNPLEMMFGVRKSLVRPFERQRPGTPGPDGRAVATSWTRTGFDIVLAPVEGPALGES